MKNFKLMAVAFVAILGLTACNNEPEYIYDDHSADLAGTWTCLREDFAEVLVIKADGSVLSTGSVFGEEYWEDVKGNIAFEKGNVIMTFEDGDIYDGHFDIIPGRAFSICNAEGRRFTYDYCANDLADEIVGMWVCNDASSAMGGSRMMIQTFSESGKSVLTGFLPLAGDSEQVLNNETDYKVVGDLLFISIPADKVGGEKPMYVVDKLVYRPNGTAAGDVMTLKSFVVEENQVEEIVMSFLRIKQHLELAEKKYDYIKTFVTNVKGLDKDIDFMGYTFNFAKMDGYILDKMLKTLLFTVEFPDANTIKYGCHYNNEPMAMEAPIAVDGNKMTVKMSEKNAAFRDIDLYTFQDQDNTQMHMYMPTYAFVNFFGNMQCTMMSQLGQLDLTDEAAVKAVYDSIDDAVEAINVSFVMTKAAR